VTTRNQAMNALLNVMAASGTYVLTSRRNRAPESFDPAETPALMLIGDEEKYEGKPNVPVKRVLYPKAIVYIDVGGNENAIPDAILSDLLDGIDLALKPDNPLTGFCTLGGLIFSVIIEREKILKKASGDVTGKALAVLPIQIILP
jgi:hypothetical protein